MSDMVLTALNGGESALSSGTVKAFADGLHGSLISPDSADYDQQRAIWNAMIDRRPGLIARCADSDDVVRSVNFARDNDLLASVRGGGHNIAGLAVCDGGLMIDLSAMRSVHTDPAGRTVTVGPGATLGDVDQDTQRHGLATPVGVNSTTGIAGLTLGGGFGWLSRKYGMTIDNLLSAEVVKANGERVHASAEQDSDLFWGIRGGGGNFGVVTSFQFRLHEVGPEVLSGLIVHPFAAAPELLAYYRDFVAQAPDELTAWALLRKAPPLPFLPEAVHGTDIAVIALCYAGPMGEGAKVVQPLRDFGNPIADVVMPHSFAEFQKAFDPLLEPGARNYWKSHNLPGLSDDFIETTLRHVADLPSPQLEVFIAQMGGATSRVPSNATAYPHRSAVKSRPSARLLGSSSGCHS